MLLQEMIAMNFVLLALGAFFCLIGIPFITSLLYLQFRRSYEKRTGRPVTFQDQAIYILLSLVSAIIIVWAFLAVIVWVLDNTMDFSSS